MSENFNIDELLAKLQNDTEVKQGSRVKKLTMNTPDNVGATITCLPILEKGEIYTKLDAVRELQTESKFFRDGEQSTWCRLLDRSVYGDLTQEEQDSWTRTKNALEDLIDASGDFYLCRFRRYTLVPVYILDFVSPNGVSIPENLGPALLIFPSHSFIKSLKDAIDLMAANMKGNQWMPLIFSPSLKGRKGALSIKFTRSSSSKGYDTTISFAMNSEWATIVDPNKDYSSEITIDPIKDFLSWQGGNGKLFNKEFVDELGDKAQKLLDQFKPKPQQSESDESVSGEQETQPHDDNTTSTEMTDNQGKPLPF